MYSLYDPVYGLKVGAHHQGQEADPNTPTDPEPHLGMAEMYRLTGHPAEAEAERQQAERLSKAK